MLRPTFGFKASKEIGSELGLSLILARCCYRGLFNIDELRESALAIAAGSFDMDSQQRRQSAEGRV